MKWRRIKVDGVLNETIRRETDGASGAYAIRDRHTHHVLYVGESHTGRLWKTLIRHFHAVKSALEDRSPLHGPSAFAREDAERYEVTTKVTSSGKRTKADSDEAAMSQQAAWIERLKPQYNSDPGTVEEEPFHQEDEDWSFFTSPNPAARMSEPVQGPRRRQKNAAGEFFKAPPRNDRESWRFTQGDESIRELARAYLLGDDDTLPVLIDALEERGQTLPASWLRGELLDPGQKFRARSWESIPEARAIASNEARTAGAAILGFWPTIGAPRGNDLGVEPPTWVRRHRQRVASFGPLDAELPRWAALQAMRWWEGHTGRESPDELPNGEPSGADRALYFQARQRRYTAATEGPRARRFAAADRKASAARSKRDTARRNKARGKAERERDAAIAKEQAEYLTELEERAERGRVLEAQSRARAAKAHAVRGEYTEGLAALGAEARAGAKSESAARAASKRASMPAGYGETHQRGKHAGQMKMFNPRGGLKGVALAEYVKTHWGEKGSFEVEPEVVVDPSHGALVLLGTLERVVYSATKGEEGGSEVVDWDHKFGRKKPRLAFHVCADPKCPARGKLTIVGGAYRVNERGIVG